MAKESNRNRGAARAAAANGAGWTSLAGMAGYKGVNRSWSVPSRIRVRGCRSLSCPTVSGALASARSLKRLVQFSRKPLSCVVVSMNGGGSDPPPASPAAVRVSSMSAQGLSLCELVRTSAMYSPVPRRSTLPHSTGPSPSDRPFGPDRRRHSPVTIRSLLFRLRSRVPCPDPTPGTASAGTSLALISAPTAGWLQAGLCIPCCSPFRLRVSHYSSHTCPLDDTRSP